MANTGFLSTSELDFNTIKTNLKTYLKNQTKFQDYDFEGSNMSVLLDILSYNTYLNAHYLNMIGSEMFLDTAQLKESVVSHAKELNYIPRSRTSAKAIVNITIDAPDSPGSVVIPKNYALTTVIDGTTLTYTTEGAIVVRNANGVYQASDVEVFEGEIVTEFYTANSSARYVLQSENVDSTSIQVEIINSNTDSTSTSWTVAESLYGLNSESEIFFIQGYESNKYELVFGNDVLGKSLSDGNIVKITYRDTIGEGGNGAYLFEKTTNIDGYSGITITTVSTAELGSERESIDSIKYNAVRHFTTQERGVTESDFVNLVKAKFPQLQAVTAYGGEDADPPQFGKVVVSVKPVGTQAVSDNLKNEIVSYLTTKTLTTEPVIVDPKYLYGQVVANVRYNPSVATINSVELASKVNEKILELNESALTNFGADLRYSKLVAAIDSADPSIVGNDTSLVVGYRWSPIPNTLSTLKFSYENELYHERQLYVYPDEHYPAFLTERSFKYLKDGTLYDAYLSDNGKKGDSNTEGQIYVYAITQDNEGNSTKLVLQQDAGTVNYYTGEVTLNLNVYSYTGDSIVLTAELFGKDIVASKNAFVTILDEDVVVKVIANTQ